MFSTPFLSRLMQTPRCASRVSLARETKLMEVMGGAGEPSYLAHSIFRSSGVRSDSQAVVSAHYFVHAPRILQTYASSVTQILKLAVIARWRNLH